MNGVCLAVLNYNGVNHLQALIPSLLAACRASPVPASIVVLDNQSAQDDARWLAQWEPQGVRCIVAPRNDFLFSYNWLLPQISEDVVVLLNNDIRVASDFIAPLLAHLQRDGVFAASARSFDWEGREVTSGPSSLNYASGYYGWRMDPLRQTTCHTLFCSGSCMAVDRRKFVELGGFHRLFYPAYCEDLDLCFRAWRRGWTCVYEPASVYWHREHASWQSSPLASPNSLNLKGSLLFQWSTLPMDSDRFSRWFTTLKILFGELLRGGRLWSEALPDAAATWRSARSENAALKLDTAELEHLLSRVEAPVPEGLAAAPSSPAQRSE